MVEKVDKGLCSLLGLHKPFAFLGGLGIGVLASWRLKKTKPRQIFIVYRVMIAALAYQVYFGRVAANRLAISILVFSEKHLYHSPGKPPDLPAISCTSHDVHACLDHPFSPRAGA